MAERGTSASRLIESCAPLRLVVLGRRNEVEKLILSTHIERTAVSTWVMQKGASREVGDLTKVAAKATMVAGRRAAFRSAVFDQKAAVLPTRQESAVGDKASLLKVHLLVAHRGARRSPIAGSIALSKLHRTTCSSGEVRKASAVGIGTSSMRFRGSDEF